MIILLLVGALFVALVVVVIMLGSTLGTLTGRTNLAEIAVGQCFTGGRAPDVASTTIFHTVEIVDCSVSHESELAASFDYPGAATDAAYPGEPAVSSYAESECMLRFADYVGVPFNESIYGMTYAYPLEINWLLDDRSIQCIAHPPDGEETMTGSVRDARR